MTELGLIRRGEERGPILDHAGAGQVAAAVRAKAQGLMALLAGTAMVVSGAYVGLALPPSPVLLVMPESLALWLFALGMMTTALGALRIYRALSP